MLAFTALDVVTVCGAVSAAVVSIISAIFSGLNRQAMKMPSGGKIGEKVEQTNHLAAVSIAHTTKILNGEGAPSHGTGLAEPDPPPPAESPPAA